MKKIIIISFWMACTFASNAQTKPYDATLGFNYNNSQRVPSSVIKSIFENPNNRDAEHNTTLNRVFSDYGMGFTTPRKQMFIDLSILQGTDYWYSNTYRSATSNDTNYTYYDYYGVSASLLGLRAGLRLSTPTDNQFFVHYSIGVEELIGYGVQAYGTSTKRLSNSFEEQESYTLEPVFTGAYSSSNIVQNVGFAVKLGKDESNFPFNKVYVESDFQLLNNITFLNKNVSHYRTFGCIVALGYQF